MAAQSARNFLRRDTLAPAAHASSAAASSKRESGSGTLLGPHTSPGGQGLMAPPAAGPAQREHHSYLSR